MNTDPTRLSGDEGISDALRTDLERAKEQDHGYDVVAGLARFEASIAAAPTATSVDPTAAASAGASKATLTIVAAVVGVVAVGIVGWQVASGPGQTESRVVAVESPPVAETRPPKADANTSSRSFPAPVPPPPAAPLGRDNAIDSPKTAAPKQRTPNTPTAKSNGNNLAAEMKATQAAKQALTTSPKRALELVSEANREFVGGVFTQERRGIEVLALFELGRTDTARRKAKRYLSKQPKGTYADRIRAKLGD